MRKKISELSMLSLEEEFMLKEQFNNTFADYPRDKCVHQLFEEQVLKTPDKTAVIACDKTLTYDQLNKQANRISHSLIKKGIGVGDVVAFALQRKSYLIATMLGILKAGAAYLPIDPDYPQNRIDYMLADSKAKLFVTEDNVKKLFDNNDTFNPCITMSSNSLCYCIFTSGSTGKPKAVSICHQNVANFCAKNTRNHFQNQLLNDCKCVLAINNIGFDIALQETFLPLLNSLYIVLSPDTTSISIISGMMNHKKSGLIITPTKLETFMHDTVFCDKLKDCAIIMVGAEVLHENLVKNLRKFTDAVIINGYGPTETTCGSCYAVII